MVVGDQGKLLLLGLVMILGSVCGTLLLITHAVDPAAGVGLITSTVVGPLGYLTGNGRLAYRGEAPSSALVARTADNQNTVLVSVPEHMTPEAER